MPQSSNKYDLENRTAIFGEDMIKFCKTIELNTINKPIVSQIIRSATSIGANYCEANNSSSKKDFRNKIFICKKETQETKHWLRMLNSCAPERKEEIKKLWKEAQELSMIFQKIINSLNKNIEN